MFTTLGPSFSATDLAGLSKAADWAEDRVVVGPPAAVVALVLPVALVVPVPPVVAVVAVVAVLAGWLVVVPPAVSTVQPATAKTSAPITSAVTTDAVAAIQIRFLAR